MIRGPDGPSLVITPEALVPPQQSRHSHLGKGPFTSTWGLHFGLAQMGPAPSANTTASADGSSGLCGPGPHHPARQLLETMPLLSRRLVF